MINNILCLEASGPECHYVGTWTHGESDPEVCTSGKSLVMIPDPKGPKYLTIGYLRVPY